MSRYEIELNYDPKDKKVWGPINEAFQAIIGVLNKHVDRIKLLETEVSILRIAVDRLQTTIDTLHTDVVSKSTGDPMMGG